MNAIVDPRSFGYFLVQNFNPEQMDFLLWLNSFEYTLDLMPIVPYSKAELLVTFLEPSVQSILVETVAPANIGDFSYDQIISLLEELYSPLRGQDAANQRFLIREQFPGESVIHYMNALWKIAEKCSPSIRDSAVLINRLRSGLMDENMKQVLLDSDNLTFNDALLIAEHLQSENNPN